ncbi:MAG: FAD-binding protein [Alphaproteobacteria bacterium]|nr:FAD-binding protein [Alphaproteobacteria bacterium]
MALSRRALLLSGAGVGAAVAVPAGMHMSWSAKDFVREGYSPLPPEPTTGEASWINWSGSQRATPQQIAFPATEQDLADLMNGSTGRVRPVGSGHSFSGLAPSEGIMVNISALQGLQDFDAETGLATFGAGTHLFQAAEELDNVGRAFANLPDIDVQTLAGTFSTATHGTGNRLTALHDYIESFRMVTAGGDIMDVSADTDSDLFNAGRVSLGALGIITQYTVRTVPEFNLHRQMTIEPVEPFLSRVEELAEAHRNFEFFYSPSTGMVAWLVHDIHEGAISGRGESEDDETLEGLKQLRDTFGWFPWLRRKVAQSAFPTGLVEDSSDESWQLLSTTRPTKFNEMEYHIPREDGVATLRKVIRMLDRRKDAFFPIEYRHIAPDDAWLSPFNGGPRSSIAIHAAAEERYDYFFSEFEPVFRAAGGRPHWGKHHSLTEADFRELYPDFDRFNAVRRTLDPAGRFLNSHLAKIFGETFDG